jgi:hypothetical protein
MLRIGYGTIRDRLCDLDFPGFRFASSGLL